MNSAIKAHSEMRVSLTSTNHAYVLLVPSLCDTLKDLPCASVSLTTGDILQISGRCHPWEHLSFTMGDWGCLWWCFCAGITFWRSKVGCKVFTLMWCVKCVHINCRMLGMFKDKFRMERFSQFLCFYQLMAFSEHKNVFTCKLFSLLKKGGFSHF